MARPGVTYLDVAKTAIQLVEQKIYPSIEEIRKALGTGSNSTINKYLREWRSKHGNQAELEQGLPESLLIAIRGIYDGIQEAATSKRNLIESESKHVIAELTARLVAVEAEYGKFMQANKLLENAMQEQKEENSSLQRQLGKLELELNKKTSADNILQELLANKKAEVATLREQLKNTQINLDHYRETVRKTREIENNLLNDKIKNLEKQLYQQQVTITKATEEITALLRNNKLLEEIKQTTLQDLNANLIKFQEQKNVIQNQIAAHNELNTKYNNILSDKAELANELKAEKVAIINLRVSLEKAQERILMCEFILEKTETKLATVSDKKYPFSYVDYKKAI